MSRRITAILLDEYAATVVTADGDRIEQHQIPLDAETALQDQVGAIVSAADAMGSHDAEIVLAIPSTWCLAAAVQVSDGAKRSSEALAYRLEEHLPIAAEDFVADFPPVPGTPPPEAQEPTEPPEVSGEVTEQGSNGAASHKSERQDDSSTHPTRLGVCVATSRLEGLVRAFEDQGIRIGWICPAALLVGQESVEAESTDRIAATFALNGHADIVITQSGVPIRWFIAPDRPDDINRILRAENLKGSVVIDNPRDRIAAFATQITSGGGASGAPWVNLRRGPLAVGDSLRMIRTPLSALVIALTLLLVCSSGAMLWRAHGYNRLAEDGYAQQLDVLKKTLPDQRVLAAPRLQLTSEHRRLAGVRGSDDAPDLTASSLADLVRLLEALPMNLRFRVLEMRLDPDRIILDGQARSHSDADAVAQALRKRGSFDVAPPRTQALKDGGVNFVLQITPGSPAPGSVPKTSGSTSISTPGSGGLKP